MYRLLLLLFTLLFLHGTAQPDDQYDVMLIDNLYDDDVSDPHAVYSRFDGEIFIVYVVDDKLKIARSDDDGVLWTVSVVATAVYGKVFVSPRVAVHDEKYEVVVVVYERGVRSFGSLRVWKEERKGEGFVVMENFLSDLNASDTVEAIQDFVYGSGIYSLVYAGGTITAKIVWTKDFKVYSNVSLPFPDHYNVLYPSKNYKLQWKEDNYLVLVYASYKTRTISTLSLYYSNDTDSPVPTWTRYDIDEIPAPCALNVITCSSSLWYIGYQCSNTQGFYTTNNWGFTLSPAEALWVSHAYDTSMEFSLGGGCYNYIAYDLVSNLNGTSYKYLAYDFSNTEISTSTVNISTNGSDALSYYGFKNGEHKISWVFADSSSFRKERYEGETISIGNNKDLSIFSLIPCTEDSDCDYHPDMCGKLCITHKSNIKTCQTGVVKNCLFNNESNCGAICSSQDCVLFSGDDCAQGDPSQCGSECSVTGLCTKIGTCAESDGTISGDSYRNTPTTTVLQEEMTEESMITITEFDGSVISTNDGKFNYGLFTLFLLLGIAILIVIALALFFYLRKHDMYNQAEKMELELRRIQQQSQSRIANNRSVTEQYFSGSNPSSSEKN